MKRYLRFCLILMLSLALPLSGMAGVQAAAEACPMKMSGMTMMDDMGMDCCNDAKSPSEHGKPCKPGQECKTGGMLQVSVIKPGVTLSSPVTRPSPADFAPEQALCGVWRPPRA